VGGSGAGAGAGAGSDVFDVEHLFLKWWVDIAVEIWWESGEMVLVDIACQYRQSVLVAADIIEASTYKYHVLFSEG